MKKLYTYILLMVCGLLFAGCQKDYLGGMWEIELEDYQGSNGKIYLNDQHYACLVEGDTVRLFDVNSTNSYFGEIVFPNDSTAKLQLYLSSGETQPAEGVELSALYSPSAGHWDNNNVGYSNNTATQYEYRSDYDYACVSEDDDRQKIQAPMVGRTIVGNGNKLHFYNLCAMIQVQIQNNTDSIIHLGAIHLSAVNGELLNGIQPYTQEVGEAPVLGRMRARTDGNSKNKISLLAGPTLGVGEVVDLYMFVPADQKCAYQVNIVAADAYSNLLGSIFLKNTKPIEIPRSKIAKLPIELESSTLMVEDGSPEHPYMISDIYELQDYMGEIDGLSKCYKLMNDIDMMELGNNFSSFAGFGTEETPFTGVLDGNGKTVYLGSESQLAKSGLFQAVSGDTAVIKNLTVDVNVHTINLGNPPIVGGITNYLDNGATIVDCIVNGSIKVNDGNENGDNDGGTAGGIVGMTSTSCNIINCTNNATIISGETVGGILGIISDSSDSMDIANLSDCKNNGELTSKSRQMRVGGIIGEILDGGRTNISAENPNGCTTINVYSLIGGFDF